MSQSALAVICGTRSPLQEVTPEAKTRSAQRASSGFLLRDDGMLTATGISHSGGMGAFAEWTQYSPKRKLRMLKIDPPDSRLKQQAVVKYVCFHPFRE